MGTHRGDRKSVPGRVAGRAMLLRQGTNTGGTAESCLASELTPFMTPGCESRTGGGGESDLLSCLNIDHPFCKTLVIIGLLFENLVSDSFLNLKLRWVLPHLH